MVRVGLVQLAVDASEPVEDRVARALELTRSTAVRTDLVMLPELWPTGAFDLELGLANAQGLDGPLVNQLSAIASTTSTWIHGGSFVEAAPDGAFYNTSVLFDSTGSLVTSYRKVHLFGFDTGEATALTSGTELRVVHTPLGVTGLATCYDLRFPELFRALTDRGATAVLLTSGWPLERIARWNILAQARAMENQVWLLGCNEAGEHGGTVLGGASLIADPWGDVVASAGPEATVLITEIDPAFPQQVRDAFPVLEDRRL